MEIDLNLFSQRSLHIFQSALKFVSHMKHGFIGSEHLLWALSQDAGTAGRVLRRNGMDPNLIEEYLHQYDLDARTAGEFRAVQISPGSRAGDPSGRKPCKDPGTSQCGT